MKQPINAFIQELMRYVYSLLWYLLIPAIVVYLLKRSLKNKAYAKGWAQRFGVWSVRSSKQHLLSADPNRRMLIWIHAVSVGETRALSKIVAIITQEYKDYQLLITHMTPTGKEVAQTLYPQAISHYIPYDMPHALMRFYATFKPCCGIIMETEIWPNLLHYAKQFQIPLYLANARLSPQSFVGYRRVRYLLAPYINLFTGIFCQSEQTASFFKQLGFTGQNEVVGNSKFDLEISPDQINQHLVTTIRGLLTSKQQRVIIFASTREGEEKLILSMMPKNYAHLLIIVPRHPERFYEVEKLLIDYGINYKKRSTFKAAKHIKESAGNVSKENTDEPFTSAKAPLQVVLGDSMGEMFSYYVAADIAVIGGSFVPCGGQNLIEALYLQKPVIFGQSMFNFIEIANLAINSNCALSCVTPKQAFAIIAQLFAPLAVNHKNDTSDTTASFMHNLIPPTLTYNDMVQACRNFATHHKGASKKIVHIISRECHWQR